LNPVVSIIVPSYNKELFIADTLYSVIKQTYPHWELLIIDDVSTDGTNNVVDTIKQTDSRILFYVNDVNRGANYSRNYGLKIAKGKFIIFLDADDLLEKNCLEQRLKHIEHTSLDFVVFTMQVFLKKIGDYTSIWKPNSNKPLNDFLKHQLPWQTMQPIWRKEFLINLGGFNEKFSRMQDVELHTRALLVKDVLFKQVGNAPDCYYRIDENRIELNAYQFMNRWIDSALMYAKRFESLDLKHRKYLIGTIYEVFLQTIYRLKMSSITSKEFDEFENKLLHTQFHLSKWKLVLFSASKFYNLKLPRIPGINKVIKQLLYLN
jgi:glycosyltransferase involved in cell wall biosynthesis